MVRSLRRAASYVTLVASMSGCLGLLGDFTVAGDAGDGVDAGDGAPPNLPLVDAASHDGARPDASLPADAGEALDARVPPGDDGAPPAHDSGTDPVGKDCGSAGASDVDGATICGCTPSTHRPCAAGALGCPGGSQECASDGTWGACTGAADAFDEPWKTDFGAAGSAWNSVFGDPAIDVANGRLRLSTDDVVDRAIPIAGSYYITHDLTLSGGTVFTPSVYLDSLERASLPSIRRSANDMQFGGDFYAGSWSDSDPAGFAGKRAAGVLTARVTTYVRGQSKQLAVKVEAAGAVFRSGWTAPLTQPKTDVTIYRFIGENNSSIYSGSDDYVYVGALHGCARMSDADVEGAYAQ